MDGYISQVRSAASRQVEVAWFAPLCSDDFAYLGVPDPRLKSTYAHTSRILFLADQLGFNNILCPSSYQVGQDTLAFAAAVAPQTRHIALLPAIRCGETHPAMLARAIATLDHMLQGRLTLNIISSDVPGEKLPADVRYGKSAEVIAILKQAWTQERIAFSGEFYRLDLSADPVKPYQQGGGPLLYFGGLSEPARELCAQHCDVFLMWPETEQRLVAMMQDMCRRSAAHGRSIDFGLRIHTIVRDTEAEARAYARQLISQLDDAQGAAIRARALDATSLGVAHQTEMRQEADDEGYVEANVWTGIGRARSGCGCAIVGSQEQVLRKIQRYIDLGIRSFILSGYPHQEECEYVARLILPHLNTGSLAEAQGRIPSSAPLTPLARGPRR